MRSPPYGAIVLRNARRALADPSGYSLINQELARGVDFGDTEIPGLLKKGDGDIHLFASPPYSFTPRAGRFNVGLTMTERADLSEYPFHFVDRANEMDFIIVPSELQRVILYGNGVHVPIRVLPLGIDFNAWMAPLKRGPNRTAFILDRGRDHPQSAKVVSKCLKLTVHGRKSPKIEKKSLHALYAGADVFVKWTDRRGPGEGWCFPILEAMSAGCLVITNTDLPYLDEGNHLHFDAESGLTKCLEWAFAENFADMKLAGRETARALTWDRARQSLRLMVTDQFFGRVS